MSPLGYIKATTATNGNNDRENKVYIYKADFTDSLYFAMLIADSEFCTSFQSFQLNNIQCCDFPQHVLLGMPLLLDQRNK